MILGLGAHCPVNKDLHIPLGYMEILTFDLKLGYPRIFLRSPSGVPLGVRL